MPGLYVLRIWAFLLGAARFNYDSSSMGKVLKGLGIFAGLGLIGNIFLGPTNPTVSPADRQGQAVVAKQSDAEIAERLAALGRKVDELLARPASSEGWDKAALELAAQLRKYPPGPARDAISLKWRAHPAVVSASSAEVKTLVAIYEKQLPKLLEASRESYREQADRVLIDAGIESRVSIGKGEKGASLRVTSPYVGRVFADRLANKSGMYQAAEGAGFFHLEFINSIDESSIYYDLTPNLDKNTESLERDVLRKWGMED